MVKDHGYIQNSVYYPAGAKIPGGADTTKPKTEKKAVPEENPEVPAEK